MDEPVKPTSPTDTTATREVKQDPDSSTHPIEEKQEATTSPDTTATPEVKQASDSSSDPIEVKHDAPTTESSVPQEKQEATTSPDTTETPEVKQTSDSSSDPIEVKHDAPTAENSVSTSQEKQDTLSPAVSTPTPDVKQDSTAGTVASAELEKKPETPPQPVENLPVKPPPLPPDPNHSGNRFPWIVILIILLLGFLSFAAWYFHTQLQKSTLTALKGNAQTVPSTPKVLIIGTDPTYPPMENIVNGQYVGYDIDLANLIAKQMGAKVEWKNITFDSLFTALDQNQINLIMAAVTITAQREQKYEFSEEYLNDGDVIITQKSNTDIKGPADLKGKTIGVQVGTTLESEALMYTDKNDVINYPDFIHATTALVSGKVDAVMDDLTDAQGVVAANPTLKIASDPFTNDYYGIVFRKGDPTVTQVNKALDSLRERGYLTELKHKWLD